MIRSATGAHFRIPIHTHQTWYEINEMINEAASIYVADNCAYNSKIETTHEYETREVTNLEENVDEIQAKNLQNEEIINNNEENLSSNLSETKNEDKLKSKPEESQNHIIKLVRKNNIPVVPYYAVEYNNNEVVIIIGGETEGLSAECFHLAKRRKGVRVNIPLNNKIESLNTGMALGIIGFEAKRQFLKNQSSKNQD